ncbi:MAG: DJ-1/PfpI family protein [Natronomonas sp.]|jgi:protease I|uniref:DJ-1/PfpI family protein n=1 Tax=Natronomonas sp. TaxID=2184060 RepID=UPI00286FB11D|nr:DJ-1/PfpI family protein [Natronomonas sp.]MDR9429401.1 DJ-1/PfpI family protein [Natronomonas sp.]
MSIENKNIAIIVAHEFEDIEMEYCLLQLDHNGANVTLVPVNAGFNARHGSDAAPIKGRFGTPCPPIVMAEGVRYAVSEFDDLELDELDCVLYPGGFSPDHLRVVPEVVEFTKEAYDAGKFVAAICHGPEVLIEADIVDGKDVTAWKSVKTALRNAGGNYHDVPYIKDGNVLTGRCPDDLPDFCEGITEALATEEVQQAADD